MPSDQGRQPVAPLDAAAEIDVFDRRQGGDLADQEVAAPGAAFLVERLQPAQYGGILALNPLRPALVLGAHGEFDAGGNGGVEDAVG